jgi:nucleotide-binding universal stress UspA family protein
MAARPRKIIVGYDGSEGANRALDAAADLVGYGSTLAVVSVRRAGSPERVMVELAREHLLRRNVTARYLEPSGEAAAEIVKAAKVVGADLVVVGRRSALRRAMLGSVSDAVIRRAHCDVLVVR